MEQKRIEEKLRVFVENKFDQKNRKFVLNVYNVKKHKITKNFVVGVLEKKKNKRDDEYFKQKDGVP